MRFGMAMLAGVTVLASTAPASAACTGGSFAVLPVTLSSEGITTAAKVNGHPVDLLVQSNAFYSFMAKDMAEEFNLALQAISTNFSFYSGKNSVNARMGYAESVTLGKTSLKGGRFIAISGDNAPRVAILGQNILGLADTEYDLHGGYVRLRRSQGCEGKESAYWTTQQDLVGAVSLETPEGQLDRQNIGRILINDIPMRAMFSTGNTGMTIAPKAISKLGARIYDEDGHDRIKVAKLDIGGKVQTDVALDAASHDLLGEVDVIVGIDFFLKNRVYVAKGRSKLFFTANAEPAKVAIP